MQYITQIIRSRRKTLSLEIREYGVLVVRAPLRMADNKITSFICEKENWIQKHMNIAKQRHEAAEEKGIGKISPEEVYKLANDAKTVIPPIAAKYADIMGVDYGRITIRNQKTRWGSCSSKGNLNFNCLLMLAPRQVLEYVVVHELAHRKEMNHSTNFWKIVESVKPDYRKDRRWLKEEGAELIQKNCLT